MADAARSSPRLERIDVLPPRRGSGGGSTKYRNTRERSARASVYSISRIGAPRRRRARRTRFRGIGSGSSSPSPVNVSAWRSTESRPRAALGLPGRTSHTTRGSGPMPEPILAEMTTFVDEAVVVARGGRGGDGSASFRREAHVPRGGPDGGDGGRGGDVILEVSPDVGDLSWLALHPHQ